MTAISRGTLVSAMLLLMYSGAFGAQVDIHCTNKVSDTSALNKGIGNSHSGDEIRIHSNCLIDGTITLVGDRTYEGDSRTGTVIRQVGGANLSAMLASDSWTSDSTTTGEPIRIAHLTLDGNNS